MNRIAIPVLAVVFLTLSGCLVINGASRSSYDGYGRVTRSQLDRIIVANTQNRIGESQAVVLARYPAENVSLMQSFMNSHDEEIAVYRVYARTRSNSTWFERYLVFENGHLALLTDKRSDLKQIEGFED